MAGNNHYHEMFMKRAKKAAGDGEAGVCIVDENSEVLSTGSVHQPDIPELFQMEDEERRRYLYHAELNAIFDAISNGRKLENSTVYTTLYPCNDCALLLIKLGIKRVVFLEDKWPKPKEQKLLHAFGVHIEQMKLD